jgi:cytochrome c1
MREITIKLGWALAIAAAAAALNACQDGRAMPNYLPRTGGNAAAGAVVIAQKGCGSCHTIPGIRGAKGLVGPPLLFFSRRTMIAGELPNTPENVVSWIRSPRSVEEGTAMPNLGLTEQEARNVAAYLYTLR